MQGQFYTQDYKQKRSFDSNKPKQKAVKESSQDAQSAITSFFKLLAPTKANQELQPLTAVQSRGAKQA